jgi:hypothetical protein
VIIVRWADDFIVGFETEQVLSVASDEEGGGRWRR